MSGRTLQRRLRVGMLGAGTVGGAVIRLLEEHREEIELRSGCSLEVSRVAVRDASKARDLPVPGDRLTTSPEEVVAADDVDIVCELIGGVEPARTLILDAFDQSGNRARQSLLLGVWGAHEWAVSQRVPLTRKRALHAQREQRARTTKRLNALDKRLRQELAGALE